jgi:hypothetical protein
MTDNLIDVALILFGLYLAVTYKWQSRKYAEFQTKTFGRKVAKWEVIMGRVLNVIVGLSFVTFGLLGLLNVVAAR